MTERLELFLEKEKNPIAIDNNYEDFKEVILRNN